MRRQATTTQHSYRPTDVGRSTFGRHQTSAAHESDRSGPNDVATVQVTGGAGDCVGPLEIPDSAVGVAMNVTIVGPTAQSNLRLYPSGLPDIPTVSNLNFSAGQAPFPNKVDVKLSAGGAIDIFNQNGQVLVLGDVVGYYTPTSLTELDDRVSGVGDRRRQPRGVGPHRSTRSRQTPH